MVRFSFAQVVLVALTAALAVGSLTFLIWLFGRRIPPSLACEGRRSGFSGSLLLFEATLVFFLLYWAVVAAVDAAQAWRIYHAPAAPDLATVLSPMVPDVLFLALFCWVALRLPLCRTPRVVSEAMSLVWVLGPVASLATMLFYKGRLDMYGLSASIVYAAAATAYLALSERVALTYGTSRGLGLKPRARGRGKGSDANAG